MYIVVRRFQFGHKLTYVVLARDPKAYDCTFVQRLGCKEVKLVSHAFRYTWNTGFP